MCCNPYMCAYPMQCVSNTRQRSKQIGPFVGPKDMDSAKGIPIMRGLHNVNQVERDYQEACTRPFSRPLITTKQNTLLKWWPGNACVPSMEQRQRLQMWVHIVLCRVCVCVWVIMLCVSVWSLCVCVRNASGCAKLLWCKWTSHKKASGNTYYGFPPTWIYVGP